jgi:hypothetical protein
VASRKNIRQDIITSAGYHPAGIYAFGPAKKDSAVLAGTSEDGGPGGGLLSFFRNLDVDWDSLSDQFVPVSATAQRGRNPKIFAVGLIPPNQKVTGRLLDRSAQVPVKGRLPKESTTLVGPAAIAEQELERWVNLTESTPEGRRIIQEEYWEAVRPGYRPDPTTVAWSAAFISYVANKGAPGSLTPADGHSAYAAIAKNAEPGPGKYKAFRPEEVTIQPNDIVIRARGEGDQPTFEDLDGSYFPSHGDVVTEVDGDSIRVIGGNLSQKVEARNYRLDSEGRLATGQTFFAVLRITGVPDDAFQRQAVEPDVDPSVNWKGSGDRNASDARRQEDALARTGLRGSQSGLLASQKAQIQAIKSALNAMASAPPLRMLVNPNKFSVKSTKIVQDGNWGRDGPIIEFWGDDQDKISGSGKVAGFYAVDRFPRAGGGGGPGLTRSARNFSQAWQNFQALWLLYRNNGGVYLSESLDQTNRDFLLSTVGTVYIYYDNILYFGSFDSFNLTESDDKPFSAEYSFEFTVRAAFLLDLPEEFQGNGSDLVRQERDRLPTRSSTQGPSPTVQEQGTGALLSSQTGGQDLLAALLNGST